MMNTFVGVLIAFSIALLLFCLWAEQRLSSSGQGKNGSPLPDDNALMILKEIEDKAETLALFLKNKDDLEAQVENPTPPARPRLTLIKGEKESSPKEKDSI